ncbi:MAG: Rab family GTPase [Promethearchaeota archaeon]
MNPQEFIFKIMVIGDPNVGKTSIIHRYVENVFFDSYAPTLGVDFLKKSLKLANITVTYFLWDVAGQSKYASFKNFYYSGSDFIIIIFDITNINSFQHMDRWIIDALEILGDKIEFAIFANKTDLEDQRKVFDYDKFGNYDRLFEFVETSAKTGKNVFEIFARIAKYLLKKKGFIG